MCVVAHPFSDSTWKAEAGDLSEFEASLVYIVGSRAARAIYILRLSPKQNNQPKVYFSYC